MTLDWPIVYPGVNDGTRSASMSGKIDGDGGLLMFGVLAVRHFEIDAPPMTGAYQVLVEPINARR